MYILKGLVKLKRLMTVSLVAVGLLFSLDSFAALNAYLTLEGETQGQIKGSVTQTGREDSIMVIAYSHDNDSTQEFEKCKGTGADHEPLVITKQLDKSTPLLYEALNNNEVMTSFALRFWQPSPTGQEVQHYTIELVNARIIRIHQEMLNNKYPENMQHQVREHVSFAYDSIFRTWEDGGVSSGDQWGKACK